MLTLARSLFSRVFSSHTHRSPIPLDETFDDIDDDSSDSDNITDNYIENLANKIDNDNDSFSDSDDEYSQSLSTKKSYNKQINEYQSNRIKHKSNHHSTQSYEKSKQIHLINTMQIAISRSNIESMKYLLQNFGIDLNHRNQYSMTYLEHAILMGNYDMVDLLIRHGCDLYQGNSNGYSYLYTAIEITTNKSLAIIRLLLESNCSCLNSLDINSLTSPTKIIYITSQDFLLLNAHLLLMFKYHICRMMVNDVVNLIIYLIRTNLLICKNDEHYEFSSYTKKSFDHFNNDYISLFIKTLGTKHLFKLEYKLKNLQIFPSPLLIPLTDDDIQPYINRILNLKKYSSTLKNLCRLLIRENLKNLKSSTIATIIPTIELQDYLLYTPI